MELSIQLAGPDFTEETVGGAHRVVPASSKPRLGARVKGLSFAETKFLPAWELAKGFWTSAVLSKPPRAQLHRDTRSRTYQAFLGGAEIFRMKLPRIVRMNRKLAEKIRFRRGQRYSRVRFGLPIWSPRTMRIHLAINEKFRG